MNQTMIALRTTRRAALLSRVAARSFVRTTVVCKEAEITKTAPPAEPTKNAMDSIRMGGRSHAPNRLEKTFLVWSGRYKSVEEIPPTVPEEAIEKARNKARIRIANYLILGTIVACVACVISGKQAAERGESVVKMNLDWHKKYNDDAAAAASAAQK
ncbi:UPF0389 protein GA21628 isoform X2 [Neocloeon triangulifer]|uniref:UPF0389 protein GA21628 isoform X2 n=1 Tax=Neocloeon triangulifer TaxID=2078957 RepID=UPI00286F10D9|nr:UPF0389 protein GA21628 isoform X2 [Neocloeon triangulifer]